MGSSVISRIEADQGTLVLGGRFDFALHRDFRAACDRLLGDEHIHTLAVDLHGVDYLDSSALGMLLLLREKALARKLEMRLLHPRGAVRQVLEVANFDRLFHIV